MRVWITALLLSFFFVGFASASFQQGVCPSEQIYDACPKQNGNGYMWYPTSPKTYSCSIGADLSGYCNYGPAGTQLDPTVNSQSYSLGTTRYTSEVACQQAVSNCYGAPVVQKPDAPSYISATAGNAQADISWGDSAGAASYTLRRSTSSGTGYVNVTGAVNIAATSFTNTGLVNGTTYYYVVTAKNSGGTSANSTEASVTPDLPPPTPTAPTNLAGVAGSGRALLTWNAVQHATAYSIKRRTTPTGTPVTFSVGGVTAYTNTGLTNGTPYYFTVVAQNVSGVSPESNKITVTPQVGLTCTDGTGEGAGIYKDAQKQLYCVARQTSVECLRAFGCAWNGTQCNRRITCTYARASSNSTNLLCGRYTGDESGCGKFVSCAYAGSTCSKK